MSETTSSVEDVKTPETPETPDYEKLKEVERNKTIALEQERKARKELEEQLSEFKKKELEEAEKEKKKKGQYEELLSEKEKVISELSEKATLWEKFQTEQAERQQKELSELLEKTPKELLEKNQDILEDLKPEKQIKFLQNLVTQKPWFNPETPEGGKIDWDAEREKAKQSGDIRTMIKLAKTKS